MKNSVFLLLMIALMLGCLEDHTNLDYREINELSVDSIAAFYTIDQFDTLKIDPQFAGTQYADTSMFYYSIIIKPALSIIQTVIFFFI